MKIRRLPAAALLAAALGTVALAGAVPASASVTGQTGAASASAESRAFSPLPPDTYWSLRYETREACWVGYQDAAENGEFTGLGPCRWYGGDRQNQAGWYFTIYIP
ncbi:hypothetical protein ACFY19_19055 [Streptosporangium saharense]|uniref:hypothetical protein n=1 Tax=Streptosporangium saharense TaxID=1706840 RepID=UPI0036C34877